jgi:hypothetical protein
LPTETPGATYGREEQVYDVFGGITRKPVAIPVEQVVTPPVEVAPTIAEAAPVEPTTPAPVTEQAAPAEAPVPKVAPVEQTTESLGLKYTETVSRMLGWEKTPQDFVDTYGSGGAQIVENAAAYVILRSAEQVGFTSISPSMVKRAKDIRRILRKQGYKVTDPTNPTPAVSETITEAVQRDVTKPEQMSFEEYKSAFNKAQKNLIDLESKLDKIKKEEFPKSVKAQLNQSERRRKIESEIKTATQNLESYGGESVQQGVLYKALSEKKPVNADVFDKLKYSSLPEGYVKQGDLYVYQPTATKPKLGEKGGVLIPTKEDFIQAGQNIYEAGMEFGAWAKQMIRQFGDAVREFLGEVWQAVSGAPAKLNELMGYLPKKGETGAVNIGGGKLGGKTESVTEPAPTNKPSVNK